MEEDIGDYFDEFDEDFEDFDVDEMEINDNMAEDAMHIEFEQDAAEGFRFFATINSEEEETSDLEERPLEEVDPQDRIHQFDYLTNLLEETTDLRDYSEHTIDLPEAGRHKACIIPLRVDSACFSFYLGNHSFSRRTDPVCYI